MKKIELSENCFGVDVEIDGESLFTHEYDNRSPELVDELKLNVISKLSEVRHKLSPQDWTNICDIIFSNTDEYEYDVDNSREVDRCDQCGNYNHRHVYLKKE
jgi:hypothetical protein